MQHILLTPTLTLTLTLTLTPSVGTEMYRTRVAHSMWLVACWCSRQQLAWG